MASKRMLSRDIICSDAYVELPFSAQSLYIQLNIEADDYGFIDSPRRVSKSIGCKDDDFRRLVDSGFIYIFSSGVVVILDWWVNNYIQPSRRKMTRYQTELDQLTSEPSGEYVPPEGGGSEKKAEKKTEKKTRFVPPTVQEVKNYVAEKGYSVSADEFCAFYESKGWMIGKNRMVNWRSAVSTWQRRSKGGSVKNDEYESIIAAVG